MLPALMKRVLILILLALGGLPLVAKTHDVPELDMTLDLPDSWEELHVKDPRIVFGAYEASSMVDISKVDVGWPVYASRLKSETYTERFKQGYAKALEARGTEIKIVGYENSKLGGLPAYLFWGERIDKGVKKFFYEDLVIVNTNTYILHIHGPDSTYESYKQIAQSCTFNHPSDAEASATGSKGYVSLVRDGLSHTYTAAIILFLISGTIAGFLLFIFVVCWFYLRKRTAH